MYFYKPFSHAEFYNPELAIDRLGFEEAFALYEKVVEPMYTDANLPGYPKDWEWRREYIFYRDDGLCQGCGRDLFDDEWGDGDVHHIIHRGQGGDHRLENLVLLCRSCHWREHPEKHCQ